MSVDFFRVWARVSMDLGENAFNNIYELHQDLRQRTWRALKIYLKFGLKFPILVCPHQIQPH